MFKKISFLLVENIFFNFFRHLFKWEQSFGPPYFFILASANRFWLITNLLLLFRAFSYQWTSFMK